MATGINSLIGSPEGYVAAGGTVGFGDDVDYSPATRGLFSGNGTDGTEMYVGGIALVALGILVAFRAGGFRAIIAS